MARRDEFPFGCGQLKAATQELPKAASLFDLTRDRLADLLSQPKATTMPYTHRLAPPRRNTRPLFRRPRRWAVLLSTPRNTPTNGASIQPLWLCSLRCPMSPNNSRACRPVFS